MSAMKVELERRSRNRETVVRLQFDDTKGGLNRDDLLGAFRIFLRTEVDTRDNIVVWMVSRANSDGELMLLDRTRVNLKDMLREWKNALANGGTKKNPVLWLIVEARHSAHWIEQLSMSTAQEVIGKDIALHLAVGGGKKPLGGGVVVVASAQKHSELRNDRFFHTLHDAGEGKPITTDMYQRDLLVGALLPQSGEDSNFVPTGQRTYFQWDQLGFLLFHDEAFPFTVDGLLKLRSPLDARPWRDVLSKLEGRHLGKIVDTYRLGGTSAIIETTTQKDFYIAELASLLDKWKEPTIKHGFMKALHSGRIDQLYDESDDLRKGSPPPRPVQIKRFVVDLKKDLKQLEDVSPESEEERKDLLEEAWARAHDYSMR